MSSYYHMSETLRNLISEVGKLEGRIDDQAKTIAGFQELTGLSHPDDMPQDVRNVLADPHEDPDVPNCGCFTECDSCRDSFDPEWPTEEELERSIWSEPMPRPEEPMSDRERWGENMAVTESEYQQARPYQEDGHLAADVAFESVTEGKSHAVTALYDGCIIECECPECRRLRRALV